MLWERTINVALEYQKASSGEISYRDLCAIVAQNLRDLPPCSTKGLEKQKQELIKIFDQADILISPDDFDERMESLYDWGDTLLGRNKRLCHIKIAI